MAQQTAVEWLVEQLARKNNEFQALTFYYDHKEEIEQAKQMEKEQVLKIVDNWKDKCLSGGYDGQVIELKTFEQYYNETYNK
jgi:hypothetical protein